MLRYLIIYLIMINIIAFFTMYIDKKRAKMGKWRIKEHTLFILALIGGSVGSIIGMYVFRHKTKKARFFIGFPAILIIEILLFFMIYNDFIK